MNKNLGWKLLLITVTLLVFLFGVFGVPQTWSRQGLEAALQKHIHLGLDLQGGTHLILQVQVNDAIGIDADNAIEQLKAQMHAHRITYTEIVKPNPKANPDEIAVRGMSLDSRGDLRSIVSEHLPEYDLTTGSGDVWTLTMKPQALQARKNRAMQQAIDTIRNRIDQLGLSEAVIEEHGLNQYQILAQLPGIEDMARVRAIVQSTAMLEIREVVGGPYPAPNIALQDKGGVPPTDTVLLRGGSFGTAPDNGQSWYLVSRASAVTGRDLRSAESTRNQNGQASVIFTLTVDGGQRFFAFTSTHVGGRLAVVLDGHVQEVAVINEPIRDTCVIEGHFTDLQAKDLAMTLRSGALPAGIKYLEERTVGPSLGSDSIRHGVTAATVGLMAVLIFMPTYYRAAGINADVALLLNLVILLGFLGFSGATLTLPGIAGVVLTVGMGVDSNVLIFERIREELRNGKSPSSAVEQGFRHAWTAIFDTHVTTIASAIILFIFGTGPVRGFAVTLSFGLFANLFTAMFVSRVIFDWVLSRKGRGEALSI